MSGSAVKDLILNSGVRIWEVADKWGVCDGNFSRRLRKPFSDKEVERVQAAIEEIKREKAAE